MTVGGTSCGSAAWYSDSVLTCVLPTGTGSPVVSFTLDGINPGNVYRYTYAGPVVASMAPNTPVPTTGATLTLVGSNFGMAAAGLSTSLAGSTVAWGSNSDVTVSIPAGVGANVGFTLSLGGGSSAAPLYITFAAPTVSAVFPAQSAMIPGAAFVTLFGTGFGPASQPLAAASLGSFACVSSTVLSDSALRCGIPSGFGTGQRAVATIASQAAVASTALFSYDGPSIASFNPAVLLPAASQTVALSFTLVGTNFGPVAAPRSVRIGSLECLPIVDVSDTRVVCVAPRGPGGGPFSVTMSVGGRQSTAPAAFSYVSPSVSAFSPARPTPGYEREKTNKQKKPKTKKKKCLN